MILNVTNYNWTISTDTCLKNDQNTEKGNTTSIFLHDTAPSHTTKPVRDMLEAHNWRVLPHAAYSPDLGPSDYNLLASMGHALAELRFGSYEDVKNGSMNERFVAKRQGF